MEQKKIPQAYFITFNTYGTWLHGDKRLSVDRVNNFYDTHKIMPSNPFESAMRGELNAEPFKLSRATAGMVLDAVIEVSEFYSCYLYAAHIRTNHAHILVQSDKSPNFLMGKYKSYASKVLNQLGCFEKKRWSRHGSTRYIWYNGMIMPVMKYIIEEQGEPMALFYQEWYDAGEFRYGG